MFCHRKNNPLNYHVKKCGYNLQNIEHGQVPLYGAIEKRGPI